MKIFTLLTGTLLLTGATMQAQDTLAAKIKEMKTDLDNLKKIKITGYIQSQFQLADSSGIKSFDGGDFASGVNKRFMIRRGRVKIVYDNKIMMYSLQLDASERGVTMMDIYGRVTEPWMKALSLTFGVMNRPFGYEIGYSSVNRETPERGRMSQILFPRERDLGAMITFQMPEGKPFHFFKLEAGVYNGTGNNNPDFDTQKDFIGHIVMSKELAQKKMHLSGGASFYHGGVRNYNNRVFEAINDVGGVKTFIATDTSNGAIKGQYSLRQYMGADLQLSYDWAIGTTTLRGEYIQGVQPGTAKTSTSPSVDPAADTYVRSFNGAYFYFIQNIAKTKNQLIVKYDWYDPNTKVAGADLGKAGSRLGDTDVKFSQLGIGWQYLYSANVKFLAYYDMVTNETSTNLEAANAYSYSKQNFHNDLKDNVLTLRVQYRF